MGKIKLSIVIPTFNKSKHLARLLSSITGCDFSSLNTEVIVVDDGSTDDTRRVCEHFRNEIANLKYVFKENGGISSARNCGISNSTGDLICFFADDYVIPRHYCEEMARVFDDESVQVVKPRLRSKGDSSVEESELFLYEKHMLDDLRDEALPYQRKFQRLNFPSQLTHFKRATDVSGAAMMRRAVFDLHGHFREDLPTGEDTEFGRRLGKSGVFVYLLPSVFVTVKFRHGFFESIYRGYTYGKSWPRVFQAYSKYPVPIPENFKSFLASQWETLRYTYVICFYLGSLRKYLRLFPIIFLRLVASRWGMFYAIHYGEETKSLKPQVSAK